MKLRELMIVGVAALVAAACSDDDGVTDVQRAPKAFVRFINAAADTGAVDFRFVDAVENLPTFLGVRFRGSSGGYQGVEPGTRPVRVFANDTTVVGAIQRLVDTTITLDAGSRYTLVYAGQARGNNDRLAVIAEDAVQPAPGPGTIAIKTIHAAVGAGALDVYVGDSGGDPLAATVTKFSSVGYLASAGYTDVAARPSGAGSLYTFVVTDAGAAAALFSATPNLPGAPAPSGQLYGPQPGVQIAGSVLSAVVFPAATPGSRSASAATASPTVLLFVDKPIDR